ncbi:MAG: hypothetical protein CL678_19185 [Bdellovibrionaceae bacterium]|nr:hypothetical protein [Pseudobdellovibrionaceae bacterium]|tara:strand:+ start:1059 stop:1973 length:915 start_codon:yes stop_codon:yes gene_type:complete
MVTYDPSILYLNCNASSSFSEEEENQITESISKNGICIIRNFQSAESVSTLKKEAELVCKFGYGIGIGNNLPYVSGQLFSEFRFPYLVSEAAMQYLMDHRLMSTLRNSLGDDFFIHHSLFQISHPRKEQILDFHIDCGSQKALNKKTKFDDYRIRSILYLTDVTSGGFSYIMNTHEKALKTFMNLPDGELFPEDQVPLDDPNRIINVNEKAGTLVLFNTHGLHRGEIPKETRIVLNTWFAQRDFKATVNPTPFNYSFIKPHQKEHLHVFNSPSHYPTEDFINQNLIPQSSKNKIKSMIRKTIGI